MNLITLSKEIKNGKIKLKLGEVFFDKKQGLGCFV